MRKQHTHKVSRPFRRPQPSRASVMRASQTPSRDSTIVFAWFMCTLLAGRKQLLPHDLSHITELFPSYATAKFIKRRWMRTLAPGVMRALH
jgi:hypothetical protein